MNDISVEVKTLQAEKAKAEAERDLAKKQIEQLQAELNVAKADPGNGSKAAVEAQTVIFNAQKAEAAAAAVNAQVAAEKARFGSIAGTDLGSTTVESGAGGAEAGLLAAAAIDRASSSIKAVLEAANPDAKPYIIFTGLQRPSFGDYRLFEVKVDIVGAAYRRADDARTQADAVAGASASATLLPEVAISGAVTAVGAAMEVLKNLGSYFRADYKFSSATVSGVDADLLAVSLAGKLKNCSYPARWSPAVEVGEIYRLLGGLSTRRDSATQELTRMLSAQKRWADDAAAVAADATEKQKLQDIANLYQTAAELYSSANKAFDDLFASLAEVDAAGTVLVTRIAEQKAISAALADGALAVLVQVAGASGTAFTKKDLWTFFGGAPFYVSGGAIASFLVVDVKGSVKAAGQHRVHSGFIKVQDVPATCTPLVSTGQARS
jgi:hypothetical protein